MVFAAYLLENAILVLSPGGAFAPYFKPHRGAFATFPKKNDKWPGGDGQAWNWLSHNSASLTCGESEL